ncbi:prepilin-type N-terminal cleavage/methylation domain-containing protein [Candidatus Ichthyocystis hellenicum]
MRYGISGAFTLIELIVVVAIMAIPPFILLMRLF